MIKIFSKVESDKILHIVNSIEDVSLEREDVIDSDNFLQLSILKMNNGKTFKPHKHIWKDGPKDCIAQESWVVIRGKVRCYFYDLDDTLLYSHVLNPGDFSVTLLGGHTYEILEDGTLVYEFKTGPYKGQSLDKIFI